MDSWSSGTRILNALADMLNMHNYFTALRVDRHEITFRVGDNPEKKTAEDVARAINETRFKNNLSRRLGITVLDAGIGNKSKNGRSHFPERVALFGGPPMTHVVAFIMAGAGLAAIVVIIITVYLLRGHDKKRDKLGDLQCGLAGTETCTKDYQDLCRARMSSKGNGNSNDGTTSSGRMVTLSQENDRPPSSRSSTSSWSEEPALTNMDISTGHMVLVSDIFAFSNVCCLSIVCDEAAIYFLFYSFYSLTWRIICVTRVVCNVNGRHFVAMRPSQVHERPLYNRNAGHWIVPALRYPSTTHALFWTIWRMPKG